jgi:hypothetical protein
MTAEFRTGRRPFQAVRRWPATLVLLALPPDWAALHATKHELRSESPNAIADVLAGR